MSREFISWASRKTKMPNCIISLPIPTVVVTATEALPLLVIYISIKVNLISFLKCVNYLILSAPPKFNILAYCYGVYFRKVTKLQSTD